MKKYEIEVYKIYKGYFTVEARSKKEAEEWAYDHADPKLSEIQVNVIEIREKI